MTRKFSDQSWFQNSLSANTTFSGADIEVVAYRSNSLFSDNPQSLDIQEMERYIDTLNSEIKKITREFQRLPENYSPNEDKDGIAQNPQRFKNRVTEAEKRKYAQDVQVLRDEIEKITKQIKEARSGTTVKLGSLHTLSYSSFREKFAVRTIGRVQARGYTQGPRTIAGTLVFNQLQQHELFNIIGIPAKGSSSRERTHPEVYMLDQIHPFNLLIFFANEYGVYSGMHLFDVTIATEGQEMSIDQIITQNAMNFYANEMIPMTQYGNGFKSEADMLNAVINKGRDSKGSESDGSSGPKKIDSLFRPDPLEQDEMLEMLKSTRGLF